MIVDEMTWWEVKSKVGEMASMENDIRQAQRSRDYWKDKFERLESDVTERYAVLPADANGETIRLRAVVMHDGWAWRVKTLMLADGGEWLLDCMRSDGAAEKTLMPEDCVIAKWRTVEDVLREFAEAIDGQNEDFGSLVVKRYADEIRQMLDD